MNQNRTEWVIHIWGRKRNSLELNDVEKFHIDMLREFQSQQKKFDKILINIALDDINDMNLFNFLKDKISGVLVNDNVEFKYCQNEPDKGEYVTFRPYVFDRIGEDVNVFYSHFKGYCTHIKLLRESFPMRVVNLCELFWSYLMYNYSLDVDDVKKKLKDHSTYCWFLLKSKSNNLIGFCQDYHNLLISNNEKFKEYKKDDLNKHSPGSFAWYNLKRIGEQLKDAKVITDITTEYICGLLQNNKSNIFTHFCEVYLMEYLDENECYSVNDFNDEINKMNEQLYILLYPSKKIGREYIKPFEKYLIDNGLM